MSTLNQFYVYEHIRNDTGDVFYIGKGKGYRATASGKEHRSEYWHRIVKKAKGFTVRYVCKNIEEELAFLIEVERIDQLRKRGIKLCNMTDGGDGLSGLLFTMEHRRKIGNAHRGKKISLETRSKISSSVKSSGFKHTSEMLKKMSEAHKGKKRALGYKHTEEWNTASLGWKQGNKSRTGQKMSEEEKRLHSIALIGSKQKIITCPFCKKEGGNAMKRWHFNNCKEKGSTTCK